MVKCQYYNELNYNKKNYKYAIARKKNNIKTNYK